MNAKEMYLYFVRSRMGLVELSHLVCVIEKMDMNSLMKSNLYSRKWIKRERHIVMKDILN